MSSESTLGPKPVLGFLMVHMALRADLAALIDEVETAPRPHLERRAALLERVVYAHHIGEDHVLLPALAAARMRASSGDSRVSASLKSDRIAQ